MSVAPNLTVSFRLFLSPYAPQARAKAVGRRPPKGASPVCDASGVENEVSTERSFIVRLFTSPVHFSSPGGLVPRAGKKGECWTFLDWRLNSENDSPVHGQPSSRLLGLVSPSVLALRLSPSLITIPGGAAVNGVSEPRDATPFGPRGEW